MRHLALLMVLAFALATAGCTESVSETMTQLRGDGGHPEPYYDEYRERIGLEHNKTFRVPVEPGASAVNLAVRLESASDTAAVPTPATLTVTVRAPNGETVAKGTLDHATRNVAFVIDPATPGTYEVRVAGTGPPRTGVEPIHTEPEYVLTTEVTYA